MPCFTFQYTYYTCMIQSTTLTTLIYYMHSSWVEMLHFCRILVVYFVCMCVGKTVFFPPRVCTEASICRVSPGTGPLKTSCSLARVEKEHSQMAVNVQTHRWLRQTIQSSFLFCSFVMTSQYFSYLFIGFLVIKL